MNAEVEVVETSPNEESPDIDRFRGTYVFATWCEESDGEIIEHPEDASASSIDWISFEGETLTFGSFSFGGITPFSKKGELFDSKSDRVGFRLNNGGVCYLQFDESGAAYLLTFESEVDLDKQPLKEGHSLSRVSNEGISDGGASAIEDSRNHIGHYRFAYCIADGRIADAEDAQEAGISVQDIYVYPGDTIVLCENYNTVAVGDYSVEGNTITTLGAVLHLVFEVVELRDSELDQFLEDGKASTSQAAIIRRENTDPSHRYLCTVFNDAFIMYKAVS